ncbi:hypothetical protein A5722_30920 [Mycobacterium vulneris]|nr:hypothetical protein A5722_30920 [Mycolicibacterium vulneris]OCB64563.1 hypothetical protein A5729_19875 [Mycolicibacterium vulneris]
MNNGVQPMMFAPNITDTELSEPEKHIMTKLASQLMDPAYQFEMKLSELYYLGLNIVPSLGISVPPELEPLRAVLGWCAAGIDARTERLSNQGFRMPGQTEVDTTLQEFWQTNNLDSESDLAHHAALTIGRSYGVAGPRPGGGVPLVTIESPLHMIGSHDLRTRALSAAFQTYNDSDPASGTYNQQLATLYHRGSTIQLRRDPEKGWIVQDRNDHKMGFVPVVQFAPRATLTNRLGRSEMTAHWRNTQDRACRNLVRMEVTGEFYATMKIILLGVSEQQFKKPDGTAASAWETFIGRLQTLSADGFGNLPDVKTVPGQSPDGFIKVLGLDQQVMSGHTGLAPQYLGIFSDGNPASADAIRMSDFRLKKIADRLSVPLGNEWESLMRILLKMTGQYSDAAEQLETDWDYTGIPTPYADTEMLARQVDSGMVPPTADDVLAKAGWSPVQRQRLEAQRDKTKGLAEIDDALSNLNLPGLVTGGGGSQPADGQQPAALAALSAQRSTDGAVAG